jgi:hypothetical protein
MTELYAQKLHEGLEYQDFVIHKLYDAGIPLVVFSSFKYQSAIGETIGGIEIKYDQELSKTGNVYFEISEKSHSKNQYYVPSGIYRNDNAWIYAIGNYTVLYLCAKNHLQRIYEAKQKPSGYRMVENKSRTSMGMLLPVSFVERIAAKILHFDRKTL